MGQRVLSTLADAAASNDTATAKVLLQIKVDVNSPIDSRQNTALAISAQRGHTDVLELLLSSKADTDAANDEGAGPLVLGARNGHVDVVRALLTHKASLLNKTTGVTPSIPAWEAASANGHDAVMQELVLHTVTSSGQAHAHARESLRLLIAAKADVTFVHEAHGVSLLHVAVHNGHAELLQDLCSARVDLNHRDSLCGATALLYAAQSGATRQVSLLLRAKAAVNVCDERDKTPVMVAVDNDHIEVLRLLCAAGADVNKADHTGRTPLESAGALGKAALVQVLLEAKADVDRGEKPGRGERRVRRRFCDIDDDELDELRILPPAVEQLLLCPDENYANEFELEARVGESLPYVRKLVRYAHCDSVLKRNLVQLLGSPRFAPYLSPDGWDDVKQVCRDVMDSTGGWLRRTYEAYELHRWLGLYDPRLAGTTTRTTAHGHPRQPLIPAACCRRSSSSSLSLQQHETGSTEAVRVRDSYNLECAFIHFLRMVAIALNSRFAEEVRKALGRVDGFHDDPDDDAFRVQSVSVKGYERMWDKMMSIDDHLLAEFPRPAMNLDVVRCLATFAANEPMLAGFEALRTHFGGFVSFKNGMAWSDQEAARNCHLRLVIATVLFKDEARPTIGFLRKDKAVQRAWDEYLAVERIPVDVSPAAWRRCAQIARGWLEEDLQSDTEVSMVCEVQMVLEDYRQGREAMHCAYKISRAPTSRSLYREFAKYYEAREHGDNRNDVVINRGPGTAEEFDASLVNACRALDVDVVERLLLRLDSYSLCPRLLHVVAASAKSGVSSTIFQQQEARRGTISRHLVAAKAAVNALDAQGRDPLAIAARSGAYTLAKELLSAKASVDHCLHLACAGGHTLLADLLASHKCHVDSADDNGLTPLSAAVRCGQIDSVQWLLEAGAQLNIPQPSGCTPLFVAVRAHRLDLCQMLLVAKAETDVMVLKDGVRYHMLHAACFERPDPRILPLLLRSKCDPNVLTSRKDTTVHFAAESGFADGIRTLVAAKVDINQASEDGHTPLSAAASSRCLEGVETLVALKCDLSAETHPCALVIAAESGWLPGLTALLAAKMSPSSDVVAAALHVAAQRYHHDAIQLLISAECGGVATLRSALVQAVKLQHLDPIWLVNSGVSLDGSALRPAIEAGNFESVTALLDAKCDVRASASEGPPLLQVAIKHLSRCVELLIQHKADLNEVDDDPEVTGTGTALSTAIYKESTDLVRLLLDKKADPNTPRTKTPLNTAALYLDTEKPHNHRIVQMLLGAKADPNFDGGAAFVTAASRLNLPTLKLMLRARCDTNTITPPSTDGSGGTSVATASLIGCSSRMFGRSVGDKKWAVVQWLFAETQCNVSGATADGRVAELPPLHHAVCCQDVRVVEFLLRRKADANIVIPRESWSGCPLAAAMGELSAEEPSRNRAGQCLLALLRHRRRFPPAWGSNEDKQCRTCTDSFSFIRRKHHCRVCGNLFCKDCGVLSAKVRIAAEQMLELAAPPPPRKDAPGKKLFFCDGCAAGVRAVSKADCLSELRRQLNDTVRADID